MKVENEIPEVQKVELPAGQYSVNYVKEVIGKTKLHKGHSIFMINLVTGSITKAEIEKTDIVINRFVDNQIKDFEKNDEVVVPDNCIPICALNVKNAIKKFDKISKPLYETNE